MKVLLSSFRLNGHPLDFYAESQLTVKSLHLTKSWKGDQEHKTHLLGRSWRIVIMQPRAIRKHNLNTHLILSLQSKNKKIFLINNHCYMYLVQYFLLFSKAHKAWFL